MKPFNVIIIGAGVVGTSIARELSRYHLRVALLEKEAELAFGVSKSNSGIIHPGTQNRAGSLKGRLCVEGNRLMRVIARELSVDFKEVGELIVAFDDQEKARLLDIKREGEALGVPRLEMVNSAWLKVNEPNLNPDAICALYAPTAGIVSPYRLVYDTSENAKRNGVEIYTDTRVEGINTSELYFEIATTKGLFNAEYVVNAAGLYADDISSMAGVSDFKITPRKGEEFILDKKREHMAKHLLFPLPERHSKGILIIKTSDGNPMIGPTAYDTFDKEDLSTTDAGLSAALKGAKRLIPSITDTDIIAYFAGLRPVAGDDFIIRHEDKAPGFVNVAGIQSPGLTSAPAIARMVAGILKDSGLSLKKKLFFTPQKSKTTHLFNIPLARTRKLIKRDAGYGDIVCRCEMVSAKEIRDSISRGARTLDGIKFRTRAQAGRCHGSFCTTRIMKILAQEKKIPLTKVTKRGGRSYIVKEDRRHD